MTTPQLCASPETRAFVVHSHAEAPNDVHRVEAEGFIDAAFVFLERWAPSDEGSVRVLVEDHATGERHCFTLHPDTGEASNCD